MMTTSATRDRPSVRSARIWKVARTMSSTTRVVISSRSRLDRFTGAWYRRNTMALRARRAFPDGSLRLVSPNHRPDTPDNARRGRYSRVGGRGWPRAPGPRRVEVVAVGELRVRVPASSANLGPGFDSFAIALPLLAEFDVRPARAWSVNVENGGNAHESGVENGMPTGEDNLFVVSARAAALAAAETLGSYHVTQRSAIPVGRGLGSSAAAIVGGVVTANGLMGEPLDRRT